MIKERSMNNGCHYDDHRRRWKNATYSAVPKTEERELPPIHFAYKNRGNEKPRNDEEDIHTKVPPRQKLLVQMKQNNR
jgi:hypothetical protein